ncbi:MAG: hypothetical protein ACREBF_03170 [Candidatus Micrarchaeales archaeon]
MSQKVVGGKSTAELHKTMQESKDSVAGILGKTGLENKQVGQVMRAMLKEATFEYWNNERKFEDQVEVMVRVNKVLQIFYKKETL